MNRWRLWFCSCMVAVMIGVMMTSAIANGMSLTEDYVQVKAGQPLTDSKETAAVNYHKSRYEIEPNDQSRYADWMYPEVSAYGKIQRKGDVDYWKVKATKDGRLHITLTDIPAGEHYDLYVLDQELRQVGKSASKGAESEIVENLDVVKGKWYYLMVCGEKHSFDPKKYYHLKATYQASSPLVPTDVFEPNDKMDVAVLLANGQSLKATLHRLDDVDYYRLNVLLASTLEISLTALPEGMDADLFLLNGTNQVLASSTGAKNRDEKLVFNGEPGTYYIKVVHASRSTLVRHEYQLTARVHTIPVILVPGIGGTRLQVVENGNAKEAWLDVTGMPVDVVYSVHRRVLTLIPARPGSVEVIPRESGLQIIPEDADAGLRGIAYLSYNQAVKSLTEQYHSMAVHLQKMGYVNGVSLFGFPYDWRLGNESNAARLKQRIDLALAMSKAKQVQLVAHSMGGLLVKEMLLTYPQYQGKTRKIVYLGAPFLGAPRAYQAIKFGYNFGIPFFSQETARQIAEYSPAVYQLLPSRAYVAGQNYLYSLANQKRTPLPFESVTSNTTVKLPYQPMVNRADQLHRKWDTTIIRVPQYSVVGQGHLTLMGYDVQQPSRRFKPFFDQAEGDGTVPFPSAAFSSSGIRKKYYIQEEHGKLPRNPYVIQQVAHLLLGIEAVQKGMKGSPISPKSAKYFVIYRKDGAFPELELTNTSGRTVRTAASEQEQQQFEGVRMEYHGNVLVLMQEDDSVRIGIRAYRPKNRLLMQNRDEYVIEKVTVGEDRSAEITELEMPKEKTIQLSW